VNSLFSSREFKITVQINTRINLNDKQNSGHDGPRPFFSASPAGVLAFQPSDNRHQNVRRVKWIISWTAQIRSKIEPGAGVGWNRERNFMAPQQTKEAENSETVVETAEPQAAHEDIALLAYTLWQQRGCPDQSSEEDWFAAEKELAAMAAR
jgi:hypothetical protein